MASAVGPSVQQASPRSRLAGAGSKGYSVVSFAARGVECRRRRCRVSPRAHSHGPNRTRAATRQASVWDKRAQLDEEQLQAVDVLAAACAHAPLPPHVRRAQQRGWRRGRCLAAVAPRRARGCPRSLVAPAARPPVSAQPPHAAFPPPPPPAPSWQTNRRRMPQPAAPRPPPAPAPARQRTSSSSSNKGQPAAATRARSRRRCSTTPMSS